MRQGPHQTAEKSTTIYKFEKNEREVGRDQDS